MKVQLKRLFLLICTQVFWMFDIFKEQTNDFFEKVPFEFCASIILATAILTFVKDAMLGWTLTTVLVIIVNFQNVDYLLLALPVLLLVAANKEASKNTILQKKEKNKKNSNKKEKGIFTFLSAGFGIFVLIYSISGFFAPNRKSTYSDFLHFEYIFIFFALVIIVIANFLELKKEQENTTSVASKNNCIVSVLALVLYIEMIGYCAVFLKGDYHMARYITIPWFEYLCILALTEDASIVNLDKRISSSLEFLAEKK